MDWVRKSNPMLVEALVATFSNSQERIRQSLAPFTAEDWASTESWLDDSGMALYLLDRLQSAGAADAMPVGTRQRLECALEDNKSRLADMLEEFLSINRTFLEDGIRYVNLKGFTLFPYSCPDLSLRQQSDCDFLIDPAHLGLARSLLEARGYVVTGSTARTLELKTGRTHAIRPGLRYKAPARRSVELHLSLGALGANGRPAARDVRLQRVGELRCGEDFFPALSGADQMICQGLHLLSHALGEHTRVSWLLEFRHHATARRDDAGFWQELRALAEPDPQARIAIGLAARLTTEIFGAFSPPGFDSWTVDALPKGARLWAELYGRRSMLADVPGTKLSLLLHSALQEVQPQPLGPNRMRALLPLRRPRRLLQAPPHDTLLLRLRREMVELQFLWFRFRFHVKQGTAYAIEAFRWRKLLKRSAAEARHSSPVPGRIAMPSFDEKQEYVSRSSATK